MRDAKRTLRIRNTTVKLLPLRYQGGLRKHGSADLTCTGEYGSGSGDQVDAGAESTRSLSVGVSEKRCRLPPGSNPLEQLCHPLSCDGELVTEISPARWWLLVTLSQAAKYARLLQPSLSDAATDMLLGFVPKRLPARDPRCGGSTRRLAAAEVDRNIGLAGC
jgi:hypothetical protein